ncbi:MAG: ABC transporter ATP-binding protein [Ruminococcus sp.]|nr:ABC transporter ATP-binding protein [Ruminococcus sp.]
MKEKKRKRRNLIKDWNNNKGHLLWLAKQTKGVYKYIAGFLVINLCTMVVSLVSSFAGKFVIDAAIGFGNDQFWQYIFLMLGTTLFTILLSFVSIMFTSYVSEKFAFNVRAKMFDRVQRSKWLDISKFHSADMLSRLTGDVSTVSGVIIGLVPTLVVAFIEFVIVLVILLKYDPVMAVIGLVVGPLGMVVSTVFRRRFVKYQKKLRESESEYYSFFQETLSNLSVTKAFQLEDDNNDFFGEIRQRRLAFIIHSSRLSAFMQAVMKIIYNLGYVVAFSWCAYRLSSPVGADGSIYTYGTMTLFLSLIGMLQGTIRQLGSIIPQSFSAVVAAKRIRAITDVEDEQYGDETSIPEKVGVRIKDLCFTYDDTQILRNVNLTINPSERVGVVGPSGAGKTTLIRLLLALVYPDKGSAEYILDSDKAETICPSSRRFISYVPQGNTIMSGTIRSNLRLACKDASDDMMWKALESAGAADFVRECPQGLDTELSEKSGGISEGQAQRIAIARALLRDRPLLILDEATSALDEDTEKSIFEDLVSNTKKTCFIITHRRSMLRYCDRVLEIDDSGEVKEITT